MMKKNTSRMWQYVHVWSATIVSALVVAGLMSCAIDTKTVTLPASDDYAITPSKLTNQTSQVTYTIKEGDMSEQRTKDWILYWDSTPVRTFAFDNRGTIWIGWRGKVIHLLPSTSSYVEFDFNKSYDTSEILIDKSGNIWTGVPIFRYSEDKWESFDSTYTLPLSISPNNTVWMASDDDRASDCIIHYIKEERKHYCPTVGKSRTTILDLVEDNNNNLWVSLRDDNFFNLGVWKLNKETWMPVEELDDVHISPYQVANAPDGSLWFVSSRHIDSTENGYVKKYDGKNWVINFKNTEIIFEIKISPDNALWAFATDEKENYLLKFSEDGWVKVLTEKDLSEVFGMSVDIYTFGFDPSGKLCLATNLGLLCKLD